MDYLHDVIIALTLMLALLGSEANQEHCLKPGQEAEEGEHPEPTKFDITCDNRLIELHCCAKKFHKMLWYHQGRLLMKDNEIDFWNFNQTLVFKETHVNHTGTYKCVATDAQGEMVFWSNVTLEVVDCSKAWRQKPIPKIPLENTEVIYAELGQTVRLPCSAFYGPASDLLNRQRYIIYEHEQRLPDGNTTSVFYLELPPVAVPGIEKHPRITVIGHKKPDSDSYGVVLEIKKLEESDLGKFTCQYGNGYGRALRSFTLALGDDSKEVVANKRASYGLVGLSALVVLLVAVVMIAFIFRLDMQLFFKEAFWHKPPEGRLYEAFVFYNDEDARDETFVTHVLQPKLEGELGYRLGLKAKDFTPGLAKATNYEAARLHSGIFLFVMSPSFLRHQWAEFAFHHAVANNHKVAFLVLEDVADDIWSEATKPMKKAMTYGGRTVKYPGEHAPMETFWKKLRLLLPGRVDKKKRSTQLNVDEKANVV